MLDLYDVQLRDLVAERCGLHVSLGHDVGSGAIAEGALGAGRGHHDWLFVELGTGLGAALVIRGEPYHGATGWGGELGHVVVDPAGPLCPCGKRGCLETLMSASALSSRYRERTGRERAARAVTELAAADDPDARVVWDTAVQALATVLAGAVEMLAPSLVVVGGGLAESPAALFGPLQEALMDQVRFTGAAPPVVPAQLGRLAGVHGAALLGLRLVDELTVADA